MCEKCNSHDHVTEDCVESAIDSRVIPAFQRENRYLVLKRRDIRNSLTDLEQEIFYRLSSKVANYRENIMEKDPLQCVVVEHDWPEYEPTWKAIEERMRG
jgi:hypothetical protein